MPRRQTRKRISLANLPEILPAKLRSPLVVVMGGSREVADFFVRRTEAGDRSFHMDLFAADQLRAELGQRQIDRQIITAADLWDATEPAATIVYPAPRGGERSLKMDIVEQAFHALAPNGVFIVVSPHERDSLFPQLLKRVFGKFHAPNEGRGFVFWCQRAKSRARRRHEMKFHVQQKGAESLRFLSRPGVFSYGRFDDGARALTEAMDIHKGDKILDLGCGCGTNGVIAGLQTGPGGFVQFLDSNLRAHALTNINAAANGLDRFETFTAWDLHSANEDVFDVILTNPPYFANERIAASFISGSVERLGSGGRFYLVTKQPRKVEPMILEAFNDVHVRRHRGYSIFCAMR